MSKSALEILSAARISLGVDGSEADPVQPERVEVQHFVPVIKGLDPDDERFVLGIVLEPGVVDLQQDRTSADEIRQAAHNFMESMGRQGFMHRVDVSDKVKILETYLAPVDFHIGGVQVKKGTWLMAWRVSDDKLWELVQQGKITGFSIGGTGRRESTDEQS